MKFSCTIDINAPRDKVVSLFMDKSNLKHWQEGFQSYEHISGEPGTPGAQAKMRFLTGKREAELTETIRSNNLPDEMVAVYEHKPVVNVTTAIFKELPGQKTQYTMAVDCTMSGILSKIMSVLMNGMVKKQAEKSMARFKAFVES